MPPWLLQLIEDSKQNAGPYAPTNLTAKRAQPPPGSRLNGASTGQAVGGRVSSGPVSGGDMADIFATAVNQMGQADQARNQLKSGVLFGRHLGLGGGEMSPGNPTGDPRDAFNNPAYFAGNQVDRAAHAVDAQPLWSNDASGRLMHGSNYPGVNGPTTPNAPTDRVSETLPPMGTQEQTNTMTRYSPPDMSFTDRGLNLTPFGAQPPNPFVKRFIPPPPPPPPPPSNS